MPGTVPPLPRLPSAVDQSTVTSNRLSARQSDVPESAHADWELSASENERLLRESGPGSKAFGDDPAPRRRHR